MDYGNGVLKIISIKFLYNYLITPLNNLRLDVRQLQNNSFENFVYCCYQNS